jgi:transposase
MFAMLTKELQVEIDVLHRQGKGIREIARDAGVSRNTVRAVLRGEHDGQYGPRLPRPSKLDPYKEYVRNRLSSAGKETLRATVLLCEIRAQGYAGGITQLKEHLCAIRPGQQLQIDFVDFRRGPSPLRAFTAELGYSRYAYVEFTDNERTETLARCLEGALAFFDGVPKHILCDNPKTIVIERNAYGEGEHRYNRHLLDVAKHYGVSIKLCAPYRAQTKGKVERFHRYLRESFFVPLQTAQTTLVDVATANREVRTWLNEIANVRTHATLKERPRDRFAFEHKVLAALPLPYAGRRLALATSSAIAVPLPVESLQRPLAVYELFAEEISA